MTGPKLSVGSVDCYCCCLVAKLWPTLCNPKNCGPSGSSVHGISQARILEWVAISFSKGSSQPRGQTQVSCIAGRLFTSLASRDVWDRLIAVKMNCCSAFPFAESLFLTPLQGIYPRAFFL